MVYFDVLQLFENSSMFWKTVALIVFSSKFNKNRQFKFSPVFTSSDAVRSSMHTGHVQSAVVESSHLTGTRRDYFYHRDYYYNHY